MRPLRSSNLERSPASTGPFGRLREVEQVPEVVDKLDRDPVLSARAVNKAPSDRPRDLQTCVPRGRVRPRGEPSGGEASRSRPRRDRDLQPAGGSRHRASAQQRGPSRPRRLPSRTTRSPRDATDDEQDAALVILAGSAGLRMAELAGATLAPRLLPGATTSHPAQLHGRRRVQSEGSHGPTG